MIVHSYMRVSTSDKGQTVENQRLAITSSGFATNEWYSEVGVSGSTRGVERPEFARMMSRVVEGDLVCVTALDRLGRDAEDVLSTINKFERMGVKVCILALGTMDVTSSAGKAFVTILSALAEMEKNVLVERTIQGLARTKAEGTILGPKLKIAPDILEALCIDRKNKMTLDALKEKYSLDRNTILRNVDKWKDNLSGYRDEWDKREAQYKKNAA